MIQFLPLLIRYMVRNIYLNFFVLLSKYRVKLYEKKNIYIFFLLWNVPFVAKREKEEA